MRISVFEFRHDINYTPVYICSASLIDSALKLSFDNSISMNESISPKNNQNLKCRITCNFLIEY